MKSNMSGRGFASVARAMAAAAVLCFAVSVPSMAGNQPPTNASPAKGEFDNSCAMGLASGQLVKTDCSVNWTAPDGKIYCFSTERSKLAFLKDPDENIGLSLRTPMRHTIAVGTAGCGGRGKLGVETQRCGLRWCNGTFVLLASSARRAAASSLG